MTVGWAKVSEMKSLSRVRLFATPWTVPDQALPSMGSSRQEYQNGLPFPSPEDIPDPGIKPRSPALQADALPSEPPVQRHTHKKTFTTERVGCHHPNLGWHLASIEVGCQTLWPLLDAQCPALSMKRYAPKVFNCIQSNIQTKFQSVGSIGDKRAKQRTPQGDNQTNPECGTFYKVMTWPTP